MILLSKMLDPRTSRTRSWNLEIKIKRSTFNLPERVSIPFKDQKMYSPAGWRVPRTPLTLNEIQTHLKMHSPAGWRVSHAALGACLLSRPEAKVGQWIRCFRTLCWKPRRAGSTPEYHASNLWKHESRGSLKGGSGILTGSVFIADDLYSTDPEDCGCFKQGLHTVTLLSKQSTYRT